MGSTFSLALLPGDGVGPEVMGEAEKVLGAIGTRFGHRFETTELAIGGAAIDAFGVPVRGEEIDRCRAADGILLGAVGGPAWEGGVVRPEQGLLTLRKALGLFANLRPVRVMPALVDASPIKAEIVEGVDLVVVRELTGGIYFGRPSRGWRERRGRAAVDTLIYREHEIRRVAKLAFETARSRRGRVASVDKANVLETSRLWRTVVEEERRHFPDVELEHVLVDAMAMHLIRSPARFDVIVTENMFGDILTDEASVLGGSIGMLPSASIGRGRRGGAVLGLYEPIHGSAPDIAGRGIANPAGMILSVGMLLRMSLGLEDEAAAVEGAVEATVAAGHGTADIVPGEAAVSTSAFGDEVAARVVQGTASVG